VRRWIRWSEFRSWVQILIPDPRYRTWVQILCADPGSRFCVQILNPDNMGADPEYR
jgi:hypothetical protein